jgi:hypothetical protein
MWLCVSDFGRFRSDVSDLHELKISTTQQEMENLLFDTGHPPTPRATHPSVRVLATLWFHRASYAPPPIRARRDFTAPPHLSRVWSVCVGVLAQVVVASLVVDHNFMVFAVSLSPEHPSSLDASC